MLNPVDVAGIQLMPSSTMLLAGSAIGSNSQAIPESETTDTWAGFVTLLDASNGDTKDAVRIDRAAGRTVRVEGLCMQAEEESVVYLVGSTNGSYEIDGYNEDAMTAFLIRLRVPELTIEWSKQLAAKPGPLSDGNAAMLGYRQPAGQDDIWIAQVDTASTEWTWIRQLGTSGSESLSDLTVDTDGNIIALGNTDGSFMRRKTFGGTDVFVLSVSRATGDYSVPVECPVPEDGPTTSTPTPSSLPVPTESSTEEQESTQSIAPASTPPTRIWHGW